MKSIKGKLLNLSTIYKVLIANSLIIVTGATVGIWLTQELFKRSAFELIVILPLIGIILSILVNFFILKTAFQPLHTLHETVNAVYRGDLTARAASGPIGDPIINRLRDTLNSMLEEISSSQKRLEELNQQLRYRESERSDLLGRIITAQEEERRRIARELHDGVSQTLTSVVMSLGSAEALVRNRAARERVELSRSVTSEAVEEVRRLIRDLRPVLLDDLGLGAAIGWYAENYLATAGVKADVYINGLDQRLSPTVDIVVFRVVQEAINNVVKHAQAKTVSIRLELAPSTLTGSIEDDGAGFDVDNFRRQRQGGGAVGLSGMEERINLLRGKLNIESQPERGTRIRFEIPWQESFSEQDSHSNSR